MLPKAHPNIVIVVANQANSYFSNCSVLMVDDLNAL